MNVRINLAINVFLTVGMQASTVILGVILTPLLISRFGTETYGVYVAGMSLVAFLTVFCDVGLSVFLIGEASKNRDDNVVIGQLMSIYVCLKQPLLIFCMLIFSYALSVYGFLSVQLPFWIFLVSTSMQPNWLFQGIEKVKTITAITIFSKVSILIYALFQIKSDVDLSKFLYFSSVLNLCLLSVYYYKARKLGYTFRAVSFGYVKKIIYCVSGFYAPRVLVAVYTQATTFIVSRTLGLTDAAIYSVADQFYKLIQMAVGAISQAMFPYMMYRREIRFLFAVGFVLTIIIILANMIIFSFVGDIITWYVGESFSPAITLVQTFLLSAIFILPSALLGFPFLGVFGSHSKANISLLIGASCYSVGLLFIYFIGVNTPFPFCILIVISELVIFAIRLWMSIKLIAKESLLS